MKREEFEKLVADYVQAFPSRSYTLNRLGDHLPEFLEHGANRENAAFLADVKKRYPDFDGVCKNCQGGKFKMGLYGPQCFFCGWRYR